MTRVVRGDIVLPAVGIPNKASQVVVQVENVSRADAPSKVVGEHRQSDVPLQPGQTIPFSITIPDSLIDDGGIYSVRAHVDISGSGEVEKGDLVSTQSYPVLTRGHSDRAAVHVRGV